MSTRRFVRDGPEVPFELLQALEDDRLLFFCGAGISFGTGLPGFEMLIRKIYRRLNQRMDRYGPVHPASERDAFKHKNFDTVLYLLEQRIANRDLVRRHIVDILTAPTSPRSLAMHRALLDLARRRPQGRIVHPGYHLVTTNFDDRFELARLESHLLEAAPALGPGGRRDIAPLVYLHGRIGAGPDRHDPGGRTLVATSADFGNAYLRHGWAARFVVDMFRDFTVLLVGYSLNDPPLRYLVDAIASERGRYASFRKVWALVGHGKGDDEKIGREWRAKGVEPILYRSDVGSKHALLGNTLTAWATEWKSGQTGRLVVRMQQMVPICLHRRDH